MGATMGNRNDQNQRIVLYTSQIEQKTKQVENATKLYYQSLVLLAAGLAAALTLFTKTDGDQSMLTTIFTFGVPAFLISWFGCYLFLYWEHHMLRISLDYTELRASKIVGLRSEETYLYHEDFLGVLNQAYIKWKPLKSVHVLFSIIGIPWCAVLIYSVIRAQQYFDSSAGYIIYALSVFAFAVILLSIHGQVLRRERALKKELGIVPVSYRRQ